MKQLPEIATVSNEIPPRTFSTLCDALDTSRDVVVFVNPECTITHPDHGHKIGGCAILNGCEKILTELLKLTAVTLLSNRAAINVTDAFIQAGIASPLCIHAPCSMINDSHALYHGMGQPLRFPQFAIPDTFGIAHAIPTNAQGISSILEQMMRAEHKRIKQFHTEDGLTRVRTFINPGHDCTPFWLHGMLHEARQEARLLGIDMAGYSEVIAPVIDASSWTSVSIFPTISNDRGKIAASLLDRVLLSYPQSPRIEDLAAYSRYDPLLVLHIGRTKQDATVATQLRNHIRALRKHGVACDFYAISLDRTQHPHAEIQISGHSLKDRMQTLFQMINNCVLPPREHGYHAPMHHDNSWWSKLDTPRQACALT